MVGPPLLGPSARTQCPLPKINVDDISLSLDRTHYTCYQSLVTCMCRWLHVHVC